MMPFLRRQRRYCRCRYAAVSAAMLRVALARACAQRHVVASRYYCRRCHFSLPLFADAISIIFDYAADADDYFAAISFTLCRHHCHYATPLIRHCRFSSPADFIMHYAIVSQFRHAITPLPFRHCYGADASAISRAGRARRRRRR